MKIIMALSFETVLLLMMEGEVVDLHVDESLRLCVHGLNNYHGRNEFRAWLTNKAGVSVFKSAQKVKMQGVGFITFETLEDKSKATELLSDKDIDGRWITVSEIIPRNNKKRGRGREDTDDGDDGDEEGETKRIKLDDENDDGVMQSSESSKTARDTVAPLWAIPYADQLASKNTFMQTTMVKMTRKIRREVHSQLSFFPTCVLCI
jgi:hypothetical protein